MQKGGTYEEELSNTVVNFIENEFRANNYENYLIQPMTELFISILGGQYVSFPERTIINILDFPIQPFNKSIRVENWEKIKLRFGLKRRTFFYHKHQSEYNEHNNAERHKWYSNICPPEKLL